MICYKFVVAYTVVLHVYEQIEIGYMKNKTFLSFIHIISTTLDKKCLLARRYNFSGINLALVFGSSQNMFGFVFFTRVYDVYGAKDTHF